MTRCNSELQNDRQRAHAFASRFFAFRGRLSRERAPIQGARARSISSGPPVKDFNISLYKTLKDFVTVLRSLDNMGSAGVLVGRVRERVCMVRVPVCRVRSRRWVEYESINSLSTTARVLCNLLLFCDFPLFDIPYKPLKSLVSAVLVGRVRQKIGPLVGRVRVTAPFLVGRVRVISSCPAVPL